jgi:hypothetical protein
MDEYGRDQFFLFSWRELQNLLVRNYRAWLKKHNGIRPRNPRSFHSSINPTDLENYKDNWNILLV